MPASILMTLPCCRGPFPSECQLRLYACPVMNRAQTSSEGSCKPKRGKRVANLVKGNRYYAEPICHTIITGDDEEKDHFADRRSKADHDPQNLISHCGGCKASLGRFAIVSMRGHCSGQPPSDAEAPKHKGNPTQQHGEETAYKDPSGGDHDPLAFLPHLLLTIIQQGKRHPSHKQQEHGSNEAPRPTGGADTLEEVRQLREPPLDKHHEATKRG
mmetsp:Transcript_140205/g.349456  ORF Transcript_140205/g.349456 Transcript_140205/m.349456 type:complete len:215 (+) Transcript_140205:1381-2025(+)